jgi:hypothetical protein
VLAICQLPNREGKVKQFLRKREISGPRLKMRDFVTTLLGLVWIIGALYQNKQVRRNQASFCLLVPFNFQIQSSIYNTFLFLSNFRSGEKWEELQVKMV